MRNCEFPVDVDTGELFVLLKWTGVHLNVLRSTVNFRNSEFGSGGRISRFVCLLDRALLYLCEVNMHSECFAYVRFVTVPVLKIQLHLRSEANETCAKAKCDTIIAKTLDYGRYAGHAILALCITTSYWRALIVFLSDYSFLFLKNSR